MPPRAKVYVCVVVFAAAALFVLAVHGATFQTAPWKTIAVFAILATIAPVYRTESRAYVAFRPGPLIFFAAALLMHPAQALIVIAVPHAAHFLVDGRKRGQNDVDLYLHALNIAMYTVSVIAAREIYTLCNTMPSDVTSRGPVAVGLLAAVVFVGINRCLLAPTLVMVRKVSWRETGILDRSSILTDLTIALIGLIVAVTWQVNPWFTVPIFFPLALLYSGSIVPAIVDDARTDHRSGLYSLRHFNTLLIAELDRAQRFKRPLAFVLLDLDGFRRINSLHGQATGDYALSVVGEVLKRTIRQYDVAGRYDRDKFALIVPETDPTEAGVLARRLQYALESTNFGPSQGSDRPIAPITACIGVACSPGDGTAPPALWQAAEAALSLAKSRGPNSIAFSLEVHQEARDRHVASGRQLPVSLTLPASVGNPGLAREYATRDISYASAAIPGDNWQRGQSSSGRLRLDAPTRQYLGPFTSLTIAVALLASIAGIAANENTSIAVIGMLAALAAVTELLQVDLYGRGTVSVSMALNFAAALLTGVPGMVVVSAAIAAAHHIRQGRGLEHVRRAAFNWAVHLISGFAPLFVVGMFPPHASISTRTLIELLVPTLAAGLAYFAVETSLIATAVALSDHGSPMRTWRRQYRWLAGHYVVLSALGLVLAVAYTQLDLVGILVFVVPVFMMRYGQTQYVLHTRDSVGALDRLSRDLSQAALTDGLTGLGNSRGFQIELQRESDRAVRRNELLSLARINVDEFRVINESLGTEAGDRVLVEIAALLRSGRAAGRAFRLGGDEFALIFSHTNTADAFLIMERLMDDVRNSANGATISVGIAEMVRGNLDYDQLREQADAALADAKRRGRNTVATFDELRDSVIITSSAQALAVHQLIRERNVEVLFQPIWDFLTARILGYEALTRPSAVYGLAGPQEAFNIAEQLRRAHDLDAICREAILARAADLPVDALLFMNVSPQTLDLDLLEGNTLIDAVIAAGLQPDRVVLEITERSMARLSVVVREAKRLRGLGFKLALDDTGAGNAGLEMLSQLPVDYVKVDKSVVSGAMTSKTARGVLAGIVAIARQTDTYVIAEGLETEAMLHLAREVRASGGQGYLLGRPDASVSSSLASTQIGNQLSRERLIEAVALQ